MKKKNGITPEALKTRPVITERILPYYQGWNLLDTRRQFNEAGAQSTSISDILEVARLLLDGSPDDLYDFCSIYATAEAAILKELSEERKREMEKIKRKQGS